MNFPDHHPPSSYGSKPHGPDMRENWRQLAALLRTRKGSGALLMTIAASVALGVIPNILQSWTPRIWLMYAAFVIAVAGVLTSWFATRDRGLGILLTLYHTSPSDTRAATMHTTAHSRHSAVLALGRDKLWPNDHAPAMTPDQIRLLSRLIDARCAELIGSGGSLTDTVLYPLMSLQDGYHLGQNLQTLGAGPTIAHFSPASSEIIPGISLQNSLRTSPTPQSQTLIAHSLNPPAIPLIIRNTAVQAGHPGYRQLALIVHLSGRSQMINEARHVAETGNPLLPDGRPTGYLLDPTNSATHGIPCGGIVIIEANGPWIPEGVHNFTAITTYIRAQWHDARNVWSTQTGAPTDGLLFFNGPLPIAIALGWALNDKPLTLVPHVEQTT